MKAVIQQVKEAKVEVEGSTVAAIKKGLLILLGVSKEDTEEDAAWLAKKIAYLRIFPDDTGKMNRSVLDIDGEVLVVSQFTLLAAYKKGNRPSFIEAAEPEKAKSLYQYFVDCLQKHLNRSIATGVFQSYMQVYLCNDGPVTIVMDSKTKR